MNNTGKSIIYQGIENSAEISFFSDEEFKYNVGMLIYQYNADEQNYGPFGFCQDTKSAIFLAEFLRTEYFFNLKDQNFSKFISSSETNKKALNNTFFLLNLDLSITNEIDFLQFEKKSDKKSDSLLQLCDKINQVFINTTNSLSVLGLKRLHEEGFYPLFFKHLGSYNYCGFHTSFNKTILQKCNHIALENEITFKENFDINAINQW